MGDLDGDGDLDIYVTNRDDGDLWVLQNDGNARFELFLVAAVGATPVGAAVGDLDRDGDLDIAIAEQGDDSIAVPSNNAGTYGLAERLAAGGGPFRFGHGRYRSGWRPGRLGG